MEYITNVEWPGKNSKGTWDELRGYASELDINQTLSVELEDRKSLESAIRAVLQEGEDMNCRVSGWRFQTTRRGTTLFIRKISVVE